MGGGKKPQNNEDFSEDELISLYEKALKKGFEAKQCVEISALPKRVQHQVLEALSILIEHGKLRKTLFIFNIVLISKIGHVSIGPFNI